jgi:hypothetical protein
MHSEKIARLAQERNANINQEHIEDIQDENPLGPDLPLVVNKNLKSKLCSKKKKAKMSKKVTILNHHFLSSHQDKIRKGIKTSAYICDYSSDTFPNSSSWSPRVHN